MNKFARNILLAVFLCSSLCACATSKKNAISKLYDNPPTTKPISEYVASLKVEKDPVKRFYLNTSIVSEYARIPLTNSNRAEAKKLANALLKDAENFKNNWDYGNAVHKSNLALGRIALLEDNGELAKKYLIAASKTPGSPQLNSFGPNMLLAQELLQVRTPGAQSTVIEYIDNCGVFWSKEFASADSALWKKGIKNGWVPNFGGNLDY